MQAQIQVLLAEEVVAKGGKTTEVAKPQIFNGISSKVSGFLLACKLYNI